MGDAFSVLHVCTGNLCRSPIAEHLMRAELERRLAPDAGAVTVRSAGTMGRDGGRMEPYALDVLAQRGIDGGEFRVRELTAAQVAAADLVLTATRRHRLSVVELDPSAGARTFTLREFARLAEHVVPDELPDGLVARARALVPAAAALRRPAARPGDDDLTDPYKGPRRGFVECASVVEQALQAPLDLWTAGRPLPPSASA